jgi:hypothetical protein
MIILILLCSLFILSKSIYSYYLSQSYLKEFRKLNSDINLWCEQIDDHIHKSMLLSDHIYFLKNKVEYYNHAKGKREISNFRKEIMVKYQKVIPSILIELRDNKLEELIGKY